TSAGCRPGARPAAPPRPPPARSPVPGPPAPGRAPRRSPSAPRSDRAPSPRGGTRARARRRGRFSVFTRIPCPRRHRAARTPGSSGEQPVDAPGLLDVELGDAAAVVGPQGQVHGAPADVDVRVVVELLGD